MIIRSPGGVISVLPVNTDKQKPRKGGGGLHSTSMAVFLRRYFAAVIALRHFLQAQESVEDALKKLPVPRRFVRALPAAALAIAAGIRIAGTFAAKRKHTEENT